MDFEPLWQKAVFRDPTVPADISPSRYQLSALLGRKNTMDANTNLFRGKG